MMFVTIFCISLFATFLSAMSGSGSAMICIPAWTLLGYPLPVALAASQVNGALWTPIAARNYLRDVALDWPLIAGLLVCGLVGVHFGTQLILNIDPEVLKRAAGLLILLLVGFTFVKKDFLAQSRDPSFNRLFTSALATPLGFYESVFGSGNGIFMAAMLAKARGFNLVTSLGYYYLVAFVWCLMAAILYIKAGSAEINLMLPSALGGILGAYLGSSIGRQKGSSFAKIPFLVMGSILGLKLLLGY